MKWFTEFTSHLDLVLEQAEAVFQAEAEAEADVEAEVKVEAEVDFQKVLFF